MKPQGNHEIYCIAHERASSDLTEIHAEFEKLRLRKEQLERLIAVLKPILGEEDKQEMVIAKEDVDRPEATSVAAAEANGRPLGVGADPFQRRIDHVLGIGAGIRDVRQYTRQF